jgi:hypothetical protein
MGGCSIEMTLLLSRCPALCPFHAKIFVPGWRLIRELMATAAIEPVYPCLDLIAERVNRDTYHSVESHWNFFGGFIAYRALAHEIVKRTNASIVDFGELVTLPGRVHAGGLGVRLDPEQVSPEHICRVQVRQKQNDFREWALRSRPLGGL